MKRSILMAAALAAISAPALAQPPAAAPAAPANPLVSANPTYVTIPMEITVNKPAKDVWARVGKYCDISEWLQIAAGCKMLSGKEGDVGGVRSVGNEVMVAKTDLSYAYTQTVKNSIRPNGATTPYNLYHGNLEVKALTPTTSKIVYTLMFDNSMLADDAARTADLERRRTAFMRGMQNMKILAEGGTLPPPPAPPAPPAPAAR